MRHLPIIILSVLALAVSCKDRPSKESASAETGEGAPSDSIYCRDPFIVADASTKTYYLYRSSTTPEGLGGVEAFTSKDLKTWTGPERVFTVTPYAAQMAAEDASKTAYDAGLRKVKVFVKGPGAGRESAIRTINNAGIVVTEIVDVTPMPHNGCRPKGRRKV